MVVIKIQEQKREMGAQKEGKTAKPEIWAHFTNAGKGEPDNMRRLSKILDQARALLRWALTSVLAAAAMPERPAPQALERALMQLAPAP